MFEIRTCLGKVVESLFIEVFVFFFRYLRRMMLEISFGDLFFVVFMESLVEKFYFYSRIILKKGGC